MVKEKPPHTISTRGQERTIRGNNNKKKTPIDNFIIAQKRSFVNLGQYGEAPTRKKMTVKKEMGARCPATVSHLVPQRSSNGRPSHRLSWPTVAEIFLIITQGEAGCQPKRSFYFSFCFRLREIGKRFLKVVTIG